MATFVLALLLALSTDRLFLVFNPPRFNRFADDDAEGVSWTLRVPRNLAFPMMVAFLIFGGLATARTVRAAAGGRGPSLSYKFEIPELPGDFLPTTIENWRLVKFDGLVRRTDDDNMAARSQHWRYTNGQVTAVISLDYPYPSLHDLQGCYENIGWTLADRKILDVPPRWLPPPEISCGCGCRREPRNTPTLHSRRSPSTAPRNSRAKASISW